MPTLVPFRPAVLCALALTFMFSLAASAPAKGHRGAAASLRVVGKHGRTLDEGSLRLGGRVSVLASPRATCFGRGTGGSGAKLRLSGGTALGLLVRAAKRRAALSPLLVTDHFADEFGLGICGVGGTTANARRSWYLKVNHRVPALGGERVKVHGGDEVLWGFGAYPYPEDLALRAPARVQANAPFTVRVFSYDEKGKRTPAAGAAVSGASGPTDASGRATVTLAAPARLVARMGSDTPSARVPVCVGRKCPGSGR